MAVLLENSFTTARTVEESFATVRELERVIPCVEGGRVIERTSPDQIEAEIVIRMGAMSLTFTGTVEVIERDEAAHRIVLEIKSREAGGQGHANATVEFNLSDGGGVINTSAQITGKAASMGEGVVFGVLDEMIKNFAGKFGEL
jgi:carbon monoxide dehydrogenase subunit G